MHLGAEMEKSFCFLTWNAKMSASFFFCSMNFLLSTLLFKNHLARECIKRVTNSDLLSLHNSANIKIECICFNSLPI